MTDESRSDVVASPPASPDLAVRKVKSAVRTVELLEYLADRSVGLYVRLLAATAVRLLRRLVVEVPAALRGRSGT